MEHAGSEATVRIGPLETGGFYVEDDGPGIPPENRDSVFDRGFTTDSAGTGLGLVLVQQVAEAHCWEIRVTESSQGGARFEFHARPASSTAGLEDDAGDDRYSPE